MSKSVAFILNYDDSVDEHTFTSLVVHHLCYLLLPNFSCHFPLVVVAGALAFSVSATSSTVSWTVAMAFSPSAALARSDSVAGHACPDGDSRIRALEVFF